MSDIYNETSLNEWKPISEFCEANPQFSKGQINYALRQRKTNE